jgi:hypothetical protein
MLLNRDLDSMWYLGFFIMTFIVLKYIVYLYHILGITDVTIRHGEVSLTKLGKIKTYKVDNIHYSSSAYLSEAEIPLIMIAFNSENKDYQILLSATEKELESLEIL